MIRIRVTREPLLGLGQAGGLAKDPQIPHLQRRAGWERRVRSQEPFLTVRGLDNDVALLFYACVYKAL